MACFSFPLHTFIDIYAWDNVYHFIRTILASKYVVYSKAARGDILHMRWYDVKPERVVLL